MLPLLLALVVFALVGAGTNVWLRQQVPTGSDDLQQGLEYLSGLRWADFVRLVLRAMHARGYATIGDDGKPIEGLGADGKDILLKRGTQRTLLSCKHGSASIVSAQAILGLGKNAQLRGADASIVVTPGRFDEEARRVALQHQIELIDGENLWQKVKPLIPAQMLPGHERTSKSPNRHAAKLAWAAAAVLGGITWLLAYNMQVPTEPEIVAAPAVTATPAATSTLTNGGLEQIPTDVATLEQRRRDVAESISTLFGVDRAIWTTRSTLVVNLSSADANPITELCPLLERYPELAASRIQLQPPLGSDHRVRFMQCRAY